MGARGKTLLTFLLIAIVGGVYAFQSNNKELFQGKIFTDQPATEKDPATLPDLRPKLELQNPQNENDDLTANVTVENIGNGEVSGTKAPFKYTLYINGAEVISNTDSYTSIAPKDAFSFKYPIPRDIYNYPTKGTVKFLIDTENAVPESNEDNNEIELEYSF